LSWAPQVITDLALAGRAMDPIIPAIRPDPFDDGLSCSNSSSTPSLSAGEWDKTPLPAHSPIFPFNLPLFYPARPPVERADTARARAGISIG